MINPKVITLSGVYSNLLVFLLLKLLFRLTLHTKAKERVRCNNSSCVIALANCFQTKKVIIFTEPATFSGLSHLKFSLKNCSTYSQKKESIGRVIDLKLFELFVLGLFVSNMSFVLNSFVRNMCCF
jgi:hypothetical protein